MVYGQLIKEQAEDELLTEQMLQIIDEAYVGKTDTLLEIEKQIGVIRTKLSRFKDLSGSKEVQELNRLFEKQFGMDTFALWIDPSNTMNAYTMVLARNFDVYKVKNFKDSVEADRGSGFRFKQPNPYCITATIYLGLLGDKNFTDGEILAILLHEIGHNFADFIDNKIRLGNIDLMNGYMAYIIYRAITTFGITLLVDLPAVAKMKNKYKKKEAEQKQKRTSPIGSMIGGVGSAIGDFLNTAFSVLNKINPLNYLFAKINKLFYDNQYNKNAAKTSLSRRNEIIADKFAGVYGYGPELSSGLLKLDNSKSKAYEIVDKLPGGKKINDKYYELYKDINEFDCHPYTIQRINENIKLLKDELNQEAMDPKMKSIIISQINDLEKIIKEATVAKNEDERETKYAIYNAYINDELPDATTKEIEKEITDNFNKIMDKK